MKKLIILIIAIVSCNTFKPTTKSTPADNNMKVEIIVTQNKGNYVITYYTDSLTYGVDSVGLVHLNKDGEKLDK